PSPAPAVIEPIGSRGRRVPGPGVDACRRGSVARGGVVGVWRGRSADLWGGGRGPGVDACRGVAGGAAWRGRPAVRGGAGSWFGVILHAGGPAAGWGVASGGEYQCGHRRGVRVGRYRRESAARQVVVRVDTAPAAASGAGGLVAGRH